MAKLRIRTDQGWKTVRARVFGLLAVHPSFGIRPAFREAYTITHIPTGFAIHQLLENRNKVIWFARTLSRYPIWNFKRPTQAVNSNSARSGKLLSTTGKRFKVRMRERLKP